MTSITENLPNKNNFINFVYIIRGVNKKNNRIKYYIGYTNNLYKRIRQHNCELKGGAKATKGYNWQYCSIFTNIRSNIEGLQLEKRLQICKKKGNITDKINTFFQYIDKNNVVSPNGIQLKHKIFAYVDKNLLPKTNELIPNPQNALIFNIKFDEILINHLMYYVIKQNNIHNTSNILFTKQFEFKKIINYKTKA
jgi:predicted GIY-YIG superfamily endonuclease